MRDVLPQDKLERKHEHETQDGSDDACHTQPLVQKIQQYSAFERNGPHVVAQAQEHLEIHQRITVKCVDSTRLVNKSIP